MRILFIGDVVGRSGRDAVMAHLPRLIADHDIGFTLINGENSAGGFGITEPILQDFLDAGADVVTGGNHSWDQRDALVFIARQERLLRPANFPKGTPGRGVNLYTARSGQQVLVVNAMGRLFMDAMDDPFAMLDEILGASPLGGGADAIIVDFHAEATSEKMAMGHHLDGRVSLVAGTHTHVPTADHQVLPGGTGYISDVGMSGDYDSIIGMDKDEPMRRFLTKVSSKRMEAANGEATLCGISIDTDDATGLATRIGPVRVGGRLEPVIPAWWK